jgi:polyhydroxyalkanoate synthesis regulator protein
MIKIYKYKNRKIYNRTTSKYIKLTQLLDLVNQGETIQVIEFDTRRDITVDTVTKAFFEAGLFHSTVRQFLDLRRGRPVAGVEL